MKHIDITNRISGIEDVPLCPICDQPVDGIEPVAIGKYVEDDYAVFCLVHLECAN